MSKRKTMYKIDLCAELQVGQRVAVVERKALGYPTVRIGYVNGFSIDNKMIYVDYRWRKDRVEDFWTTAGNAGRERQWDLVHPYEGQVEVYMTDKSLQQMCAAMRKHHPDWKWVRGVK